LVEVLERQYDQDEPLNAEMVFELAVRALEAEATTLALQQDRQLLSG
jgi:hypothetical protein